MAITLNSGFIISATDDGDSCRGKNEIMAMSVAHSRPMLGAVAPLTTAVRIATPRFSSCELLSTTTIALSTSMPMAIINPANDVRLRLSPRASITSRVAPMLSMSELPTITPERQPMVMIIRSMTMANDSARFIKKSLVASRAIMFSGYIVAICIPAGSLCSNSRSRFCTMLPTATTSSSGSVAMAMAIASLRLWRTI